MPQGQFPVHSYIDLFVLSWNSAKEGRHSYLAQRKTLNIPHTGLTPPQQGLFLIFFLYDDLARDNFGVIEQDVVMFMTLKISEIVYNCFVCGEMRLLSTCPRPHVRAA